DRRAVIAAPHVDERPGGQVGLGGEAQLALLAGGEPQGVAHLAVLGEIEDRGDELAAQSAGRGGLVLRRRRRAGRQNDGQEREPGQAGRKDRTTNHEVPPQGRPLVPPGGTGGSLHRRKLRAGQYTYDRPSWMRRGRCRPVTWPKRMVAVAVSP